MTLRQILLRGATVAVAAFVAFTAPAMAQIIPGQFTGEFPRCFLQEFPDQEPVPADLCFWFPSDRVESRNIRPVHGMAYDCPEGVLPGEIVDGVSCAIVSAPNPQGRLIMAAMYSKFDDTGVSWRHFAHVLRAVVTARVQFHDHDRYEVVLDASGSPTIPWTCREATDTEARYPDQLPPGSGISRDIAGSPGVNELCGPDLGHPFWGEPGPHIPHDFLPPGAHEIACPEGLEPRPANCQ